MGTVVSDGSAQVAVPEPRATSTTWSRLGRRALFVVTNALVAAPLFSAWCAVVYLPGSSVPGEAFEGWVLTSLLFFPLAFIITYPPLTLLSSFLSARSRARHMLLGPWFAGLVLGLFLGPAVTHTPVGLILANILRVLNV
jgi:hypothetical protein